MDNHELFLKAIRLKYIDGEDTDFEDINEYLTSSEVIFNAKESKEIRIQFGLENIRKLKGIIFMDSRGKKTEMM